ncbi:hypothetical protein [uncultured Amnibacterium sp.]|uniref:hypothetical protein n=1 Tax=uncultured Amnibacterium sp. TaxID=1631851 RepID=UPI0035CC9595
MSTSTSPSTAASRVVVTNAHLVGSINLPDAATVIGTVADHLAPYVRRIPDGEVGERYYWLQFQSFRLDHTRGLTRVGDTPVFVRGRFDQRPFALDGTVPADELQFPDLGYATAAIDSYAHFSALRDAGRVPVGVRFQVSLPTPAAVVGVFIASGDRAAVEPAYERALFGELDRIVAAVPHDDLAVQWDTALEFAFLEQVRLRGNPMQAWWDDVLGGVVERAGRQAGHVPADVQVGFHLCYGDVEEAHFVQPTDTGTIAQVLGGLFATAPRHIDWVHLPVPIERDDAAYFAPLASVTVPVGTEIDLGLVHHEDGVEGAERRIAAAATVLDRFGVGTECGFGRGPATRTAPLLDLHRAIVEAHAA